MRHDGVKGPPFLLRGFDERRLSPCDDAPIAHSPPAGRIVSNEFIIAVEFNADLIVASYNVYFSPFRGTMDKHGAVPVAETDGNNISSLVVKFLQKWQKNL